MKFPTKLFLLSVLCMGLCTGMLAACGEREQIDSGENKEEEPHSHLFIVTEIPATCDKEGKKSFTCSCGEKKEDEVIPALGHSFEVLSHKDPTCTEAGFTEKKCSRCGKTESETLPANGHRWGEVEVFKLATCEGDGLRSAVCLDCGLHEEDQVIDALGHEFEEISHLDPTCTEEGYSEKKCTRCDKTERETLSALDHDWEESRVLKELTCTEEGYSEKKCSRCDKTERETISPKGHSWGEEQILEAATCEKDGLRSAVCLECGLHENNQKIPAVGHDFKEIAHRNPTCTEEGVSEQECSRCREKKSEKLAATGHTAGESKIALEPTCSQEGTREIYCSVCKALMETESIPKKEHTFGAWSVVREASCSKEGEEKRTCSTCQFEEKRDIQPLGHKFDSNFTFDKLPTTEEEGEKSRHCLNPDCGERADVTKVEKLKETTDYKVTLKTSLGEALPSGSIPIVEYYDGEELKGRQYGSNSVNLPTKDYTVKVSGLPVGYLPKESYRITPYESDWEIRVPASLILEEKLGVTYDIGSIIYDKEFTVIGLTPEENFDTSFKKLLKDYKAILLNMYFTTCGACVYEMPHFVSAYNRISSTGEKFGDEVACVMLDSGFENEDSIRKFKQQTNYRYKNYSAAYNIPMMLIHDRWLTNYFARKITFAYPTSILIDCEGRVVESFTKSLSINEFCNMMQKGIDRYNRIHEWRVSEGLESEENTLSVRYDLLPADRKRLGT